MVRIPTHRVPTHPGEMLLEEFIKPLGITQRELADSIHVSYQRVNEIINSKRGVTPSTALRLARPLLEVGCRQVQDDRAMYIRYYLNSQ